MSWIGRGLDDVPGKPFGWAWHMERKEIEDHLYAKLGPKGSRTTLAQANKFWRSHRGLGVVFRVNAIQERIHKSNPTLRAHQLAMGLKKPNPSPQFTPEELAHMVEHFAGANDPFGQSIWQKANSYTI